MQNTALIHYWLVHARGGESTFRQLMKLHPEADIFTNVFKRAGLGDMFDDRPDPTTTWVNKLPAAAKLYPLYMPLMLEALERLDMSNYQLIVSSESGPAKWVIPGPNTRHICYFHSPMRYIWDQRHVYRAKLPPVARPLFDSITHSLRNRDVISAARVDDFVASSSFVAERIKRYYRRQSTVINAPVHLHDLAAPTTFEDYYLFAGQLVSYKRLEFALTACHRLQRRLVVVGAGPGKALIEN